MEHNTNQPDAHEVFWGQAVERANRVLADRYVGQYQRGLITVAELAAKLDGVAKSERTIGEVANQLI